MALFRCSAGLAAVALTLAGCASSAEDSPGTTTTVTAAPGSPASLVGRGCAAYSQAVPVGPGSIEGMAADPVAVAVSNSPLLTTLAGALSGRLNEDVDLVNTLDNGDYTVFVPTDAAFGKVDPATIEKWKDDAGLLTSVLDYHVLYGQADPSTVLGEHKTLSGGSLTVAGSGDELTVNDATVLCGGIRTANATIYLIDKVLMPSAVPATTSSTATTTAAP